LAQGTRNTAHTTSTSTTQPSTTLNLKKIIFTILTNTTIK